MSLSLATLVCAPPLHVINAAQEPLLGRAISMAVANGEAFVLVETPVGTTDLYAIDLLNGARRVIRSGTAACRVLGVLGNEAVVARWDGVHFNVRRATRAEDGLDFKQVYAEAQTTHNIWLNRTHDDEGSAQSIQVMDGKLVLVFGNGDAFDEEMEKERTDLLQYDSMPPGLWSLRMRMSDLMEGFDARFDEDDSLVDFSAGTRSDVAFSNHDAVADCRTGAIVWIDEGCLRVLRGGWLPGFPWSPATHGLHAPSDRARVVALMLCLCPPRGRAFPARLAQMVAALCVG